MVEDEESITEPLAEALEREGFETRVAGTVEAALAEARRELPDLVLLDVMLPDGSGYDVSARVRRASPRALPRGSETGTSSNRLNGVLPGPVTESVTASTPEKSARSG